MQNVIYPIRQQLTKCIMCIKFVGSLFLNSQKLFADSSDKEYAIPKIKMLCNLCCLKARLRLLCNKLSTEQQPEPRFKTTKIM